MTLHCEHPLEAHEDWDDGRPERCLVPGCPCAGWVVPGRRPPLSAELEADLADGLYHVPAFAGDPRW